MGSNMAEQHPVGFQWVMEAKERGASKRRGNGDHADGRSRRGGDGGPPPVGWGSLPIPRCASAAGRARSPARSGTRSRCQCRASPASAAMSAGSVAVISTPAQFAAPARRLAIGAAVFEGVSSELTHRHLGPLGEPYRHGLAKRLEVITGTGLALGTGLLARSGRRSRPAAVAGGALLAAAALSARINVFRAGRASAVDPRFTIGPQRARADAGNHGRGAASRAQARADRRSVPAAGSHADIASDDRRPAGLRAAETG